MKKLKAIFFDAAGTLIETAQPVGESYALLARKHGIEVSAAALAERFRVCFAAAPPLAFPGANGDEIAALEYEWWRRLVETILAPWGRPKAFDFYFADLFAYFGQAAAWRLFPEAVETLSALRQRGLRLHVISNFDSRLIGILEGLGVTSWFEGILISSRAGFAKPAPEIFYSGLRLHGIAAGEAMHIGDSIDKDAAGATGAGLKAVLVDRRGRHDSEPFARVRDLREVLTLVDSV